MYILLLLLLLLHFRLQVCFYAAELMLGMQHLHSLNIVYRDVKLENGEGSGGGG